MSRPIKRKTKPKRTNVVSILISSDKDKRYFTNPMLYRKYGKGIK